MVAVQHGNYNPIMTTPSEPSEQDWKEARAALRRKQDSRHRADLEQIELYEAVQRLLRQPNGALRSGARGEVERRLGVGKSLSRYIENADTQQMRRVLEARREMELAVRDGEP